MAARLLVVALGLSLAFLLAGCPPLPQFSEQGGGDTNNPPPTNNTGGEETPTTEEPAAGPAKITGRILIPDNGKTRPRAEIAGASYTIVAQSEQTAQVYRTETDNKGDFSLELPESEEGNTFIVTVLGPDGRAIGPVLLGVAQEGGLTGLTPEGETDLGTLHVPEDPTAAPLLVETGAVAEEFIDPSVAARLDDQGVPVGVASVGKGEEALNNLTTVDEGGDPDRDGLIDLVDADDDGDGIIDDFEPPGVTADDAQVPGLTVNFFMNLKIDSDRANTYYTGDAATVAAALAQDTIITLEVVEAEGATRHITGAHLLETPGPDYLTIADKMHDDHSGPITFENFAATGYAFDLLDVPNDPRPRYGVWLRANEVMAAGDLFTVEIAFDDGSTSQYSRMINYVFKNIPKLLRQGAPAALAAFDASSTGPNGSIARPLALDTAQDLVLEFRPPLDETGAYITGMDYSFAIFYMGVGDPVRQLNEELDMAATWPTPVSGVMPGSTTYYVEAEDLGALSPEQTYTVTLPKALFPTTVTLQSAETANVLFFQVDITAEAPTGNAAIKLAFEPAAP